MEGGERSRAGPLRETPRAASPFIKGEERKEGFPGNHGHYGDEIGTCP